MLPWPPLSEMTAEDAHIGFAIALIVIAGILAPLARLFGM